MRISDWSSDVCSSDLMNRFNAQFVGKPAFARLDRSGYKIGGCGGAICTARVMTSCRLSVADATASAVAVNGQASRSAERRVGEEGVRKCRSLWLADHIKETKQREK